MCLLPQYFMTSTRLSCPSSIPLNHVFQSLLSVHSFFYNVRRIMFSKIHIFFVLLDLDRTVIKRDTKLSLFCKNTSYFVVFTIFLQLFCKHLPLEVYQLKQADSYTTQHLNDELYKLFCQRISQYHKSSNPKSTYVIKNIQPMGTILSNRSYIFVLPV